MTRMLKLADINTIIVTVILMFNRQVDAGTTGEPHAKERS